MKKFVTYFSKPLVLGLFILLFSQFASSARNTNDVKAHSTSSNRPQGTAYNLFISLLKSTTGGFAQVDQVKFVVNSSFASNGVGTNKLPNGADNIAIIEGSKVLAIDGYKAITTKDTITVSVTLLKANTAYKLQVLSAAFKVPGFTPRIYDRFTKLFTEVVSDTTDLSFTPTTDTNTYGKRFAIAFKPTPLPIKFIFASAERTNNQVQVKWNTIGESKVAYYVIEKSANTTEFTTLSTVNAKNTFTASYSFLDAKVSSKIAYYRIKAVDIDGKIAYSNIENVAEINAGFNIYPNPIVGNILNIESANFSNGRNIVDLYNTLGKKVFTTTIEGASNKCSVNVGKLAAGQYNVVISSEGKILFTKSLQVNQ